ncbi:SKP1 interacting partner 3 [Heracleum sosnowskyi]|uniref:SKP1 interacting partner 3 n=1 Tax=Heracleum sosnowskyi TaxID=360622 RepID=A0AAD8IFC3_9APIA|nr:SKP1 interacting partner 3 [Heracleum sosnowskyi]
MAKQQTEESRNMINYFDILPEECVADLISYTTPVDACRLTAVASSFRSVDDSDAVWEQFLPSDYQQLISRAVTDHGPIHDLLAFSFKKDLYLFLCDHPLIIDSGALSFSLDKRTGKKCFMLAASELRITWGDTPMYWRVTSDSESRFTKVIELIDVCSFIIYGKISTSLLSPQTAYTTYLVYKPSSVLFGFKDRPIEVSVGIIGEESINRNVYLNQKGRVQRRTANLPMQMDSFHRFRANQQRPQVAVPKEADSQYPATRKDGWLEIKLAEYYNKGGENTELEINLKNVKWMSGLIIEGIEIRREVTLQLINCWYFKLYLLQNSSLEHFAIY